MYPAHDDNLMVSRNTEGGSPCFLLKAQRDYVHTHFKAGRIEPPPPMTSIQEPQPHNLNLKKK